MEPITLIATIAAGTSLAAVAGLRAFLPLFVIGIAARNDLLPVSERFAWLESTPALVLFGLAVVFELLADKIPAVDHVFDAIGVVVKPIAGMASVAAVAADMDPMWRTVIALLVGGSVAGSVHIVKAKARLGSSLGTGGLANPIVSLFEDAVAVIGAILAVLAPLVALVLLIVAGWLVVKALRRVFGRRATATI